MNHAAAIAIVLLGTAAASRATTWTVDPWGGGDFETIQAAIHAAASGDEIVAVPATYVENLDYLGKDLWIRSAGGPAVTAIDGSEGGAGIGSCVRFTAGETRAAVLEGFTLTGGEGTGDYTEGGGVLCTESAPTLRHCRFVANVAQHGGAIRINGADPLVVDCEFRYNIAQRWGGAINGYGSPTILRCRFESNSAMQGGAAIAISSGSAIVIEDCLFKRNIAGTDAGAINLGWSTVDAKVTHCVFEGNMASGTHGGAMFIHEASATIDSCLFLDNWAILDGGGIMALDGAHPNISHCTFHANSADRNGGNVAIWSGAYPVIANCILAEATSGGGIFVSGAWADLSCNDVWHNAGGNYVGIPDPTGMDGNISADPLFCGEANQVEPFALFTESPCAAEYNPECGQIGARPVGCDVAGLEEPEMIPPPLRLTVSSPSSPARGVRIACQIPEGAGGSPAGLTIHDASGRLIRRLAHAVWTEGEHTCTWDGADEHGETVPAGVYVCRLSWQGKMSASRVVLLH